MWEEIARAVAPGGVELVLYGSGDEVMLRADGLELMSSRAHASEEGFAERALSGLVEPRAVLIGGLGLGYTVRAAARVLPPSCEIAVAELVPEVVAWHRGPLAHLGALDDPRVRVHTGDVAERIAAGTFDAILLDVDNGTDALMRPENAALYGASGLAAIRRALRSPGVLAVWCASPSPTFAAALDAAGFRATAETIAARGAEADPLHTLYYGWV